MSYSDLAVLLLLFSVVQAHRPHRHIFMSSVERREMDGESGFVIGSPPAEYETSRPEKQLKRVRIGGHRMGHRRRIITTTTPQTTTYDFDIQPEQPPTTHLQEISVNDIDFVAVCEHVKSISAKYRIRNLPKFARNNCPLIKMYYPHASCEDITTVIDYCFPELAAEFQQ